MNIFEIVNEMSSGKNDLSEQIDLELRNTYGQFMINRIFSCAPDTLFLADVANKLEVNDLTHYLFWDNIVTKRKRYFKYPKQKKTDETDIKLISEYYNISFIKSQELIEILSEKQIQTIKDLYKFGRV